MQVNPDNLSSTSETSADRVKLKRDQKRHRKLLVMKHSTMVILLLLSVGLTSYAVSEFVARNGTNASASQPATGTAERVHDCFATVGGSSLELSLPGNVGDVIGVGFHQAERVEAIAIKPQARCMVKENSEQIKNAVARARTPVLFVMNTRGRQSASTSAMDVAMKPDANVYSPVDGVVTKVKTYNLYNKVMDYHVEIQPDGYPDLRVAIIHIDRVGLDIGQRVERRKTLIGRIRALPQIQSQIQRYLPLGGDHVHMQVNPADIEGELGS